MITEYKPLSRVSANKNNIPQNVIHPSSVDLHKSPTAKAVRVSPYLLKYNITMVRPTGLHSSLCRCGSANSSTNVKQLF